MGKTFTCRDAGVNCDWRARGETTEALMKQISEHARTAHKMVEIPKDVVVKVKSAIREDRT